jgi:glutamine cyclotransferase
MKINHLPLTIYHLLFIAALTACSGAPANTPPALPATPPAQNTATAVPVDTAYPAPTAVPTNNPYPAPTTGAPPTAYPAPEDTSGIPTYTYRVINSYPHDPNAFTQGLLWDDGVFYESAGLYNQSSLRRVDPETGEVLQIQDVPPEYFAEGLVLWDGKLIQLTWQENTAFIYDKDSLEKLGEFSYPTEGWGITHDGRNLIMSDGTATLYFRDPETFAETGRFEVRDANGPVVRLNELEYIDGEIWANIWQDSRIARIDPATGQVTGWIDLTGILDNTTLTQQADVLNGIAYDPANGRIFITGKLWPTLFEIEVVPVE